MASAFSIAVDVSGIENMADKLSGLSAERVSELMVDAINTTTETAYELSRKAILSGINLTDDYVQTHMVVEKATAQNPKATIVALGGRGYTTSLSHYGAMQMTQGVLHPKRSRGDAARGIPIGRKAAGMSVEVTQGSRKPIQHGFTMPGKKDSAGNLLVFTRDKFNRIKSRSGPAVYQLFRVAAERIEDQVYGDLENAVIDAAEKQFAKELS